MVDQSSRTGKVRYRSLIPRSWLIHAVIAWTIVLAVAVASAGQSNPESLRDDVTITRIRSVPLDAIRIDYHGESNTLLYLTQSGNLVRYDPTAETVETIATSADHGVPTPRGLAMDGSNRLYLLGNSLDGSMYGGIVRRASIEDGTPSGWTTVLTTGPYPGSFTPFDHLNNGLVISPDGRHLYIGSGSRTDHGEIQDVSGQFPGLRETALTTVMLRIPADTTGLIIPNDSTLLGESDFRFAAGFRNAFDLAWGPGGDLFGTENSGDRDDPEELNWIREGRHYGFPWRIGGNDTPQQFPDYNPDDDPLVGPAVQPVFGNDPGYPAPPLDVRFEEPILNIGPDADAFRDSFDGSILDASESGVGITTFTAHRSPLGLVFDTAGVLAAPYSDDGFVLSWTGTRNPLLRPLGDSGEDLLHLDMSWDDDDSTYVLSATQIVRGFVRPIDAVLVDTSLYVLEMGFSPPESPSLWRIDFPRRPQSSASEPEPGVPSGFSVSVFPNPAWSTATVEFEIPDAGQVSVALYDVSGRLVARIAESLFPAGRHALQVSAGALSPGIYILRMEMDRRVEFQPIVRVR